MKKIIVNNREVFPTKIVCIGRNFSEHIRELGNEPPEDMVIFVKPNSAISNSLQAVHIEPLHYEGELCFACENGEFVALGFGLDLTKRGLQKELKEKGLPWERAKAFNGAALFSHFVKIPELLQGITFDLEKNGENVQHGNIDLMLNKPQDILTEIQSFMDLSDGDVVMTGTPCGVGIIQPGDIFVGRVKYNNEIIVSATWYAQ